MNPLDISQYDMTGTAQGMIKEQNAGTPPQETEEDIKQKKKHAEFKQWIEACKNYRRKLITNWNVNIDYRRAKVFASQTDQDRVSVPLDWSLTKTKAASLFSQIPQVRMSHPPNSAAAGPWLASFEGKLNDTLITAGIESAMDEVLPDCINAAGFGAVIVSYEAMMTNKAMPVQDAIAGGGAEGDTMAIPTPTDHRYLVDRISPADFLWPLNFIRSDFDKAPWLGRSGRITWPEAMQRFGLSEKDKDKYVGDERTFQDKLVYDTDRDKMQQDNMVSFDEIFFKEFQCYPDATSYTAIRHLIFLADDEKPVVDEPWKGQKVGPDGQQVIGAQKFPIRVLTLAYISDEAIPPSDTAMGRSQVDELNTSRGQVLQQRSRSIPMRWADWNRMDPTTMHAIMKGNYQHIIPVQGDGSRILGEVARADRGREDFTFDQVAKSDLNETWSIGPNQLGSGAGVETKGESSEIASNFQTRIGRERAKTAAFFTGISEVLGGILCIMEEPTVFGEGFNPAFSKSLCYSILPDSTILLDANQRLERMHKFIDMYAKSGFIQLEPVLREIAILSGLDPNTVIKAPDPQTPPPPNVSLRISGAEDMMNPLVLASFLNKGQAPTAELIDQAKQLIQQAVAGMPPPPPSQQQPGMPPMGPEGPMPPPPPGPPPTPTPVGEALPNATILPTISKRSGDNEGGGQ